MLFTLYFFWLICDNKDSEKRVWLYCPENLSMGIWLILHLSRKHRVKLCSHLCTAITNWTWYDQHFTSAFRICRQKGREALMELTLPFPQHRIVSLVPNTSLWQGIRLSSLMPPPSTICSYIPYILSIHSPTVTCLPSWCSTPNPCLYHSCFPKCCQLFSLSPGWLEMTHERLDLTAEKTTKTCGLTKQPFKPGTCQCSS